jgi:hypothetical protein
MRIIDPGHIYETTLIDGTKPIFLKFIKRGGGAIQYSREWPGIQTQAVMRALINYLGEFEYENHVRPKLYHLWQLGLDSPYPVRLCNCHQVIDILDILIDRSHYLNSVLVCVETSDACYWMGSAQEILRHPTDDWIMRTTEAIYAIRMALWNYEARAYRRKQEAVNRKHPEHDDTARPRPWRHLPVEDVPFNEEEIELRPIGSDGHIVLERELA